jgi:hypothetical protein
MKAKRLRLIFQDEAPRIGCGERGCSVKMGRKWVYIRERASGATARLHKSAFDKLAAASQRRLLLRRRK